MPPPKAIGEPKQLVVEGADAKGFFEALLAESGLRDIQVQNYGGVSELADFLQALYDMPRFRQIVSSIGIAQDAETDPTARFQSVCSAVSKLGWVVPAQPMVPVGSNPQVTVLILPDAHRPGMLEDLLLDAIAADPVMPCVDDYFRCVSRRQGRLPNVMPKARIHAFLASRERPHLHVGHAAAARYFPWTSPAFAAVKQFLRSL